MDKIDILILMILQLNMLDALTVLLLWDLRPELLMFLILIYIYIYINMPACELKVNETSLFMGFKGALPPVVELPFQQY